MKCHEQEQEGTLPGTPCNLADLVKYAQGAIVSRTIAETDSGNVTLFAFAKGQGLSEHTAPFNALVNVIDGEGEFTIGSKPHRVKAGQVLCMPAGIPHAVRATKKFKMTLTMIKR
jgi:quercetin dioxygenase-like cupin family protein